MTNRSPATTSSGVTAVGSSRPSSAANASDVDSKRFSQCMVTTVGKIIVIVPAADVKVTLETVVALPFEA